MLEKKRFVTIVTIFQIHFCPAFFFVLFQTPKRLLIFVRDISKRRLNQLCPFIGVQCVPTDTPPFYQCVGCPPGFFGNGTNCREIDEVETTLKTLQQLQFFFSF